MSSSERHFLLSSNSNSTNLTFSFLIVNINKLDSLNNYLFKGNQKFNNWYLNKVTEMLYGIYFLSHRNFYPIAGFLR